MDIHRIKIFEERVSNVEAIDKSSYELDSDRRERLPELIEKVLNLEYWHPVFQAWKNFFDTYLKCGCNPSLMQKYGKEFLSKEDYLIPPACAYSNLFSNVLRLRNARGTTLFNDYVYGEIKEFCEVQCKFFMTNRKAIKKQLYTSRMYDVTLRQLLADGSWGRTIKAIYLLRHCQLDTFKVPVDIQQELEKRIQTWVTSFDAAFKEVTIFVSDNQNVYRWYCPKVMDVVDRIWSSSLIVEGRPRLLTGMDTKGLMTVVKDQLVSYVNTHPLVEDNPFYNQTVWDCLCNVFFANDTESAGFIDKSFYVLCIPKGYIDRLVDILFDFYWIVKKEQLTSHLYTLKVNSMMTGDSDSDESPEEYLQGLYMRGFPELGKE